MSWIESLKYYLFTPEGLQQMIIAWGYIAVIAIVFAETGLMVGFFLPGDSLLFMAGVVAGTGHLDIFVLYGSLSLAAILGDTLGYWIGAKAGHAIYDRPDSFFFRKKHLLHARAFYEKHGGKTIVLARFVPIVRTFAPVVAGAAEMEYRRFLSFNIFGGIGWVVCMTSLGYFLGRVEWVQQNLEKMVLAIIFVSVLPILLEYARAMRKTSPEVL